MPCRMSEIYGHPVLAATKAFRFADHVTKTTEGYGDENGSRTLPPFTLQGSGKASSKAKSEGFSELTLHQNLKKTTHNSNKEYASGVIQIIL